MPDDLHTDPAHSGANAGDDDQLGRLFSEYMDRLNDGERLSAEDILAAHPELGEDLVDRGFWR